MGKGVPWGMTLLWLVASRIPTRKDKPPHSLGTGRERRFELSLSLTRSLLPPLSLPIGWPGVYQAPSPGQTAQGATGTQRVWAGSLPQRHAYLTFTACLHNTRSGEGGLTWLGELGSGRLADLTAGWEATGGVRLGAEEGHTCAQGQRTEDRSLERSTARETQATAGG